jgi:hypothetical protein
MEPIWYDGNVGLLWLFLNPTIRARGPERTLTMHRRLILRALAIVPTQRLGEGEGGGTAGAGAGAVGGAGDTGTGGTPPAAAPPPTWEYVEKLRREAAESRVKAKAIEDENKQLKEKDMSEVEKARKEAKEAIERATAAEAKARLADIKDALVAQGCNPKKVHLYAGQVPGDVTDYVVVAQQFKKDYPEDFRPQAPAPARTTGGQAAGAQDAGLGHSINDAIRQAARR